MKEKLKEKIVSRYTLLILLILVSFFSITIGVEDFSIKGLFMGEKKDFQLFILSRLPRLLSVIVTGASLSIFGVIMQTITNNKFVSPSTTGIMDWAKFGIMIAML